MTASSSGPPIRRNRVLGPPPSHWLTWTTTTTLKSWSVTLSYDHAGQLLWSVARDHHYTVTASIAADLDGDGDLEVLTGADAYHHDGTTYIEPPDDVLVAYPQVANLDADPWPEIIYSPLRTYVGDNNATYVVTDSETVVLDHDGTMKTLEVFPSTAGSRRTISGPRPRRRWPCRSPHHQARKSGCLFGPASAEAMGDQ